MLENSQHILEALPDYVWITDEHHCYIASSEKSAKILGFPSRKHMLGTSLKDIPCDIDTDELIKQRDDVLKNKKTIEVLDIHPYANGEIQAHHAKRLPYFNSNGKLEGVMTVARELNHTLFSKLILTLTASDQHYYNKHEYNRSYELIMNGILNLSKRELECYFYVLRGFTAKKISVVLHISARTVEVHIDNIKSKMQCTDRSELIEKGLVSGILQKVPLEIIKNLSVLL